MATSFPLDWPPGVPRCSRPQRAQFGSHSVAVGVAELRRQVSLLGPRILTISSNLPLRQDGIPYSNPGKIHDAGVACYFRLEDVDYCLPCDRWDLVEHNLWAIAKHIDAMRGMRRWGVGSTHQAFAGYKALPAKTAPRPWREVLGAHGCPERWTRESIDSIYRRAAVTIHPDVPGGSHDAMAELNRAREDAVKELNT